MITRISLACESQAQRERKRDYQKKAAGPINALCTKRGFLSAEGLTSERQLSSGRGHVSTWKEEGGNGLRTARGTLPLSWSDLSVDGCCGRGSNDGSADGRQPAAANIPESEFIYPPT